MSASNYNLQESDIIQDKEINTIPDDDVSPSRPKCGNCKKYHSYNSGCSIHGSHTCDACWREWMEHQLSVFPNHGSGCTRCRIAVANHFGVIADLLTQQEEVREARRVADIGDSSQPAQIEIPHTPNSATNVSGPSCFSGDTYRGRPWHGEGGSGASRGFLKSPRERRDHQGGSVQKIPETPQRDARVAEDMAQGQRELGAEAELRPVDDSTVGPRDQEHPHSDGNEGQIEETDEN